MHKNLVQFRPVVSEICSRRDTDKQTHRHAHHNTALREVEERLFPEGCNSHHSWRRGVGLVARVVRRMNEVALRWARLVLGWVTVRAGVHVPLRYITMN